MFPNNYNNTATRSTLTFHLEANVISTLGEYPVRAYIARHDVLDAPPATGEVVEVIARVDGLVHCVQHSGRW